MLIEIVCEPQFASASFSSLLLPYARKQTGIKTDQIRMNGINTVFFFIFLIRFKFKYIRYD